LAALSIGLAACGEEDPADKGVVEASAALSGGYTFGIGSGISSTDLKVAMVDRGEQFFLGGGYPRNSYIQGTYSDRFTRYPEALWSTSTQNSTVPWLRSGGLFDNEQVWQTWTVDTSASFPCGRVLWVVKMDYEVDSEANYDFLTITSSDTCTSEGTRVRVSGKKSGSTSFYLPQGCASTSVTVSYSKDINTAVGLDMGRVKNVLFDAQCPG